MFTVSGWMPLELEVIASQGRRVLLAGVEWRWVRASVYISNSFLIHFLSEVVFVAVLMQVP